MKYIRYCSPSPIGLASDVVRKARGEPTRKDLRPCTVAKANPTRETLQSVAKGSQYLDRHIPSILRSYPVGSSVFWVSAFHPTQLREWKTASTTAFGKPGWILKVPVDAASTIPLTSIRNMQFFLARNVPLAHRVGFRFQFTRELGLIASHSQSYNYWNLAWRVWISPASTLFATFKVCSRIAMV